MHLFGHLFGQRQMKNGSERCCYDAGIQRINGYNIWLLNMT